MRRVDLRQIQLRPAAAFQGLSWQLSRVLLGAFLLNLALVVVRMFQPRWLVGESQIPETLLVVLAGATTLTLQLRQAPGQNVLLAAALIALIATGAHWLNNETGIPFGARAGDSNSNRTLLWALPLIWMVVLLNSRGVARLVLRPWRLTRHYGLWLIGLTVLLGLGLELNLEVLASVKHYWSWKATRLPLDWYGTPLVFFLGWMVTALAMLVAIMPALLNKSPAPRPADFSPLWLWFGLHLLFLAAAIAHRLWPPLALALIQIALIGWLAAKCVRS